MPRTHRPEQHVKLSAALLPVLIVLVVSLSLSSAARTQARLFSPSTQQSAGLSSTAQDVKDALALDPGTPIERELAGGESHLYRIMLNAGEYLHVRVEQRGIDVVVALRGPEGTQLTEMDGLSVMVGEEDLSWEAASGGSYILEVRARLKAASPGRYEVRVEKLPSATGKERARIAAERLLMEGKRAQQEGSGAGLERAAKAYDEAVVRWREAGERKWEGLTLNQLGGVYYYRGVFEKARDYFQQALTARREINDRIGEGATLNNLGTVHNNLGQHEKAREYLEQALAVRREGKDKVGEGQTLTNLGNLHFFLTSTKVPLSITNRRSSSVARIKTR